MLLCSSNGCLRLTVLLRVLLLLLLLVVRRRLRVLLAVLPPRPAPGDDAVEVWLSSVFPRWPSRCRRRLRRFLAHALPVAIP